MRWSIAVVLAALLVLAPQAMAQERVWADVPFPFIVGGMTLPAGEYWFIETTSSGARLFVLRDGDQENLVLFPVNSVYRVPGKTEARLSFHRYGNRYFLSEILGAGATGAYLPPSKAEKQLQVAGLRAQDTVVFARLR